MPIQQLLCSFSVESQASTSSSYCSRIISLAPASIASCCVKYGRDDYKVFFFEHFVNDAIGEVFRVTPANVLARMPTTAEQGLFLQSIELVKDLLDEPVPKSIFARVVPIGGFENVLRNLWSDHDTPTHFLERPRTRVFS